MVRYNYKSSGLWMPVEQHQQPGHYPSYRQRTRRLNIQVMTINHTSVDARNNPAKVQTIQ
eukprot:1792017-Amphidinium_carterae.1